MHWLNEPANWQDENGVLTFTTAADSDFWRKTHDGATRDSGQFYYQPVSGDFSVEVKVSGQYGALYDQAGLMVRVDDSLWMKCGVEYMHGVQHASVVVTRDFSDWSIIPLSPNPPALYLRVARAGGTLEVQYSVDGLAFILMRQAHLTTAATVQVGMMAAAPKGDGFAVRFEGFKVEPVM